MCLPKQDSDEQPSDTSIFGLAPRGVCLAERVTTLAGAPLPHRFTIATRTPRRVCKSGCLFSVALVVAPDGPLPTLRTRPAVSRLAALRCSDFPLPGLPPKATNGQRPSHPLPSSQKSWHQKTGGGGGIRTLDTVSRIQHFQCCAFSHSATPPTTDPTAQFNDQSRTYVASTHQPAAILTDLQPRPARTMPPVRPNWR